MMIKLHTNLGVIGVEVDAVNTPKTAQNFIDYVQSGHYDGTIFHRVINGFMIQGGGFAAGMKQKETKAPIENEAKQGIAAGLKNTKGTLAMARTSDPHSASAQFFINVGDNDFLDYPGQDGWGYAVFGKVVEGMDVVEKIKGVPTGTNGFHRDVPVQDVVIERAEIV
ncbi:MAG TPA: peptidylprolyl isomerase [Rhodocyclaceae bacterium]|nr:peptidylprolyl isomerase [Rhodocyclaceae bacterium]